MNAKTIRLSGAWHQDHARLVTVPFLADAWKGRNRGRRFGSQWLAEDRRTLEVLRALWHELRGW